MPLKLPVRFETVIFYHLNPVVCGSDVGGIY